MIRRAEDRDISGVMDLLLQVDMVHHGGRPDIFKANATKYTKAELIALIKDSSTPVFVYVNSDGAVLGHAFCSIQQEHKNHVLTDIKTLYIDDICVDEGARGSHIGKALYDYVIGFARQLGCYNVTLNVWACNPGAMRFYEKMGMTVQKIGMEKIL